jgi:predicted nucleic acid-binding Zn ribbon protein
MSEERTKFCPHCGTMIPYDESYCPACGEPQPILEGVRRKTVKKTWIAVLLSLLVTGLGHVYLGRWRRGLTILAVTLAVGGVASLYLTYDQVMFIGLFFALFSAYDAYLLSRAQN